MNFTHISQIEQPDGVGVAVLHHIGFVVPRIATVMEGFAASVGAQATKEIIYDPLQQVSVAFLRHSSPGPSIELIEPAGDGGLLSNLAKRGGGLHHLCYEVDDLAAELELARSQRGIIVKRPLPAVAFQGRRISWVFTRYRLLLEYLER
jgi:methylmalonyl-CoA/ethylmalonyl-CoA epimerase